MNQKVIIAPNAFKGALDAFQVAEAISSGLKLSRLTLQHEFLPIADGGDGTLEVLVGFFKGTYVTCRVDDPLGRPIQAKFGLIDEGKTAVIEMAAASGIRHLKEHELNPLEVSTSGTGQLIRQALDRKVDEVIITLGGSATVDGALGMLQELGLQVSDKAGNALEANGKNLQEISEIDLVPLQKRVGKTRFTLLCDVDNPLLGEKGAAAVFGPQKGATAAMIPVLESGLKNFSQVTKQVTGMEVGTMPHGGAAGGCAAFLHAYLDAQIVDGAAFLLNKMGVEHKMKDSSMLITAEGRIDEQTRHGKGPYSVAKKAHDEGLLVVALAGQIAADFEVTEYPAFDAVFPIGAGPSNLDEAIEKTALNLKRTATQIGNLLAAQIG